MGIDEYRERLSALLATLPEPERDEAIAFYLEAIADRMEEGMGEADAVASVASPGEAAEAILANGPAPAAAAAAPGRPGFRQRLRTGALTPGEWVGIIALSPFWFSLGLAGACCLLALAIVVAALWLVVWVLVAACWAVGAALVAAVPMGLLFTLWGFQAGDAPYALVQLGYACIAFGAGFWALRGSLALTRSLWRLQAKGARALKAKLASRKGGAAVAVTPPAVTSEGAPCPPQGPGAAAGSDAAEQPVPGTSPAMKAFFTACWIAFAAGLVLVAVGFAASGFDWRVFLSSFNSNGSILLASTLVADPRALLFGDLLFWWL